MPLLLYRARCLAGSWNSIGRLVAMCLGISRDAANKSRKCSNIRLYVSRQWGAPDLSTPPALRSTSQINIMKEVVWKEVVKKKMLGHCRQNRRRSPPQFFSSRWCPSQHISCPKEDVAAAAAAVDFRLLIEASYFGESYVQYNVSCSDYFEMIV